MDIGLKNEFKTCHSSGLSSILFSGELGFISIIVFNGGVFLYNSFVSSDILKASIIRDSTSLLINTGASTSFWFE